MTRPLLGMLAEGPRTGSTVRGGAPVGPTVFTEEEFNEMNGAEDTCEDGMSAVFTCIADVTLEVDFVCPSARGGNFSCSSI